MKEVVLDTETTGISIKEGHRIVEIGCIELENLIPTKNKFHCYLNPERKVSEKALEVHGYSDEFLAKQNMIIKKVKSPISESLKSYQKKFPDYAKALGNMRSTKRLEEIQELRPAYNLMVLMGDALTVLESKVKFRFLSGQHNGGWMGFGLNRMDYFFALYYSNPEALAFRSYLLKIDETKFDGKLGKIWFEVKRWRWMNELNLVADGFDFFAETKGTQLKILKNFLTLSYNYIQKIKA